MAVRELKKHPDEVIINRARLVDPFIDRSEFKSILQDMIDTMDEYDGIGLAAPQIGISLRIIVFKDNGENKYLVNPTIIATSDMVKSKNERCLSVDDKVRNVRRAKNITVKGFILDGDDFKEITIRSKKKLLSFQLQHEIDHLNGMTIMERGK